MASHANETDNIWHQYGKVYRPGTTLLDVKKLPPAVYRYEMTMTGWQLTKVAPRYEFPFKIYGVHTEILDRVKSAWQKMPTNFGVLLNGLKGTGKTVTAQQIVNWAINEGLIVISVTDPIDLGAVLSYVEQPLLVLFDEFEKTHEKADAQQSLLSALDGLYRSAHRRMFLFTTNDKNVNSNLLDRPSRIRYIWEFKRLGSDIIDTVLDDLLDKKLSHLRAEIISYLTTREVLTIDVVKTVVNEVNMFGEGPQSFRSFMNLSDREPAAFRIDLLDDAKGPIEVASYFKSTENAWLQSIMTKGGRQTFLDTFVAQGQAKLLRGGSGQLIRLIAPTDAPDEWVCEFQVPAYKTWIDVYPRLTKHTHQFLWVDERPSDWVEPKWAKNYDSGDNLAGPDRTEFNNWYSNQTIYGGRAPKRVRLRFTLEHGGYTYDYRAAYSHKHDPSDYED